MPATMTAQDEAPRMPETMTTQYKVRRRPAKRTARDRSRRTSAKTFTRSDHAAPGADLVASFKATIFELINTISEIASTTKLANLAVVESLP